MLGLHTESELSYIGVSAKLAPASPRGLTRTLHKLARTPSDSVAFRIGMVRNTWGRVKTSLQDTALQGSGPKGCHIGVYSCTSEWPLLLRNLVDLVLTIQYSMISSGAYVHLEQ